MNRLSEKLINAVKCDLKPSLGVTEPGAIAYAAATAARALDGRVKRVTVRANSGVYKNSFTCFVPGTDGMGCELAAALGAVAGDPERKLMATEGASAEAVSEAKRLVAEGLATAELISLSPDIRIEAEVETENGTASALIEGRHDRITKLTVNGSVSVFGESEESSRETGFTVSSVAFGDIVACADEAEDIGFVDFAAEMNMELYREGSINGLTPLTEARHGCMRSGTDSAKELSDLFTCGAIEARVRGANSPAMAITGSGSHGILCTLPVWETARFYGISDEERRKALLLSMLVTMYIKENSGLLSTACGCVLAGGTGACLGITYLLARNGTGTEKPVSGRNELVGMLTDALNSMAASVTGMICHGGNTGCSLKASVGVSMAFSAAEMALKGRGAESVHGILGASAEATMRNMGAIASSMRAVEGDILRIMQAKKAATSTDGRQEK